MPACAAVIVHVPAATTVAVAPDVVQTPGVVEAKFTGRPDVAVADNATVAPELYDCAAGWANPIVWVAGLIKNARWIAVAAA